MTPKFKCGAPTELPAEAAGRTSLSLLFQRQVFHSRNTTAIEDDQHSLSYDALHAKALCLAGRIQHARVSPYPRVGILIPRGINHVIAQMAVIYAGGSCVPLNPELPDEQLIDMLKNLDVTLVLVDTERRGRLSTIDVLWFEHEELICSPNEPGFCLPRASERNRCCHILHTCGSTGAPNAVEILADGLINLVLDPACLIKAGQRVGHGSAVTFDMSLLEIWGCLLRGATIVVISLDTLLNPRLLQTFIRAKKLDTLQLTASLLNLTAYAAPAAFSTLDTLITGGEAINCRSIQTIMKAGAPSRIINGYGPTECTVYALWHRVSPKEAWDGDIPVGRPFRNITTFLTDDSMVPVKDGDVGELVVMGTCVSGGYLGQNTKTARNFLEVASCVCKACPKRPSYIYRTGDLMRVDQGGLYHYVGRKDDQIKIRGQRVELGALGANLVATTLVSTAVVVKITPDQVDKPQLLVAFCVPSSPEVDSLLITRAYVSRAPQLMLPRVELIETLPLTTSGKVNKAVLVQQYQQNIQAMQPATSADTVQAKLRYIWLDVLGLPDSRLTPEDDFISMGGNSLIAAIILARINQTFDIYVHSHMLYENPTLEKLTRLVHIMQSERYEVKSLSTLKDTWLRDAELGSHLRPSSGPAVDWLHASEGRVFLTGATGFVGSWLLALMGQSPKIRKIACLVRATDKMTAERHLRYTLQQYCLDVEWAKVLVIVGDFSRPMLGLTHQQYDHLAEWSSVVFHLGAKVNYVEPYSAHHCTNIEGTVHMLQFASHRRLKPIHYTSTVAAFGPTGYVMGTSRIMEDERPETHWDALQYDMGYAQSQAVAEMILWKAIDRGFPIAIYRPGFVLGNSQTGICNAQDFMSRVFKACTLTRSYPHLPKQRKEFVPVDWLVQAMLHIAVSPDNLHHAYNLVMPNEADAIDLNSSFGLFANFCSHPMRCVAYHEWIDSLPGHIDSPMKPLIPMLKEKVLGDRTRWEVYENTARYGRDNLHRALRNAPEIQVCKSMTQIFNRYVEFWSSL